MLVIMDSHAQSSQTVSAQLEIFKIIFTFVGRISAMTVQAMAPKPIMKLKMMRMMVIKGTQLQAVRAENCLQ